MWSQYLERYLGNTKKMFYVLFLPLLYFFKKFFLISFLSFSMPFIFVFRGLPKVLCDQLEMYHSRLPGCEEYSWKVDLCVKQIDNRKSRVQMSLGNLANVTNSREAKSFSGWYF